MRFIAFAFALMLLASFCFSANYSSTYIVGDWLKVTRTIAVAEAPSCAGGAATGACSSTGAIQPSSGSGSGVSTSVILLVENTGAANRQDVEISESLAFVPTSARLHFDPAPTSFDGQIAKWSIPSLRKGELKAITYSFPAQLNSGELESLPAITAKSASPKISIVAPASSPAGQKIAILLKTEEGLPLANAVVSIGYPDGTTHKARTGSDGTVRFTADLQGFYTYSAEGYSIAKLLSTEVQPAAVPSNAASAVGATDALASLVASLLPALAAIFAAAVLVLLAYNFLTSKKEEEPYYAPMPSTFSDSQKQMPVSQSPASSQMQPSLLQQDKPLQSSSAQQASPIYSEQKMQQATAGYSQKFVFGQEQQKSPDDELTRSLVESRKKQLQSSEIAQTEPKLNHSSYSEKTLMGGEHAVSLASQATSSGELTRHEDEIEKTMRELEDIRRKLQERRALMQKYVEQSGTFQSGERIAPEERPSSPKKPAPKIANKSKPKAAAKKRR